jgi:hypothetical protein
VLGEPHVVVPLRPGPNIVLLGALHTLFTALFRG